MNPPSPYLESIGERPFALVSINPGDDSKLYLPHQTFSCEETELQFYCQTKIQDRLLDLNLTKKSDNPFNIRDCFAAYGGQTVSCRGFWGVPVEGLYTYEITGLGLSPPQLQRVQQKYWAINILMRWSEDQLIAIGNVILSLIAGMAVACFTSFWLYTGQLISDFVRSFISLTTGIIIFGLSWYFFLFMLLSLGYAD